MPGANDDLLSRVQLEICDLLARHPYFSQAPAIPVISEVMGDFKSRIEEKRPSGMLAIVALVGCSLNTTGGAPLIREARVQIRIVERIAQNRSATGTRENALRVAQQVVTILLARPASSASDSSGTKTALGGVITVTGIERSPATTPDSGDENNWTVTLAITGGSFPKDPLTRADRATTPDGSP